MNKRSFLKTLGAASVTATFPLVGLLKTNRLAPGKYKLTFDYLDPVFEGKRGVVWIKNWVLTSKKHNHKLYYDFKDMNRFDFKLDSEENKISTCHLKFDIKNTNNFIEAEFEII